VTPCIENKSYYHNPEGYPRTTYNRLPINVARLIMQLIYGKEAVEGKLICHKCNNTKCINPNHLYIGTDKTNAADRRVSGGYKYGLEHRNFKVNVPTAVIVSLRDDYGMSLRDIAAKVGMSKEGVSLRLRKYRDANNEPRSKRTQSETIAQ